MNLESHTSEQLHEQTTPSIVESFSQSQIKSIQEKLPSLGDQKIAKISKDLQTIESTATTKDKEHITKIIKQLLSIITITEQDLLPTIINNLRKSHASISTNNLDILGYINTELGRSKTEVTNLSQQKNAQSNSGSDTISDEEKKVDQQLAQKTAEIEITTQIDQELKAEIQNLGKTIQGFYERTDTIQESERKPQKSSILEKLNKQELLAKDGSKKSMLITLQQAFGYNFQPDTILPDGTKKTNYEAWMMNDTIDNQITILLYNYARLQDKIKQSQQPNSKVKVTEQEKQQAQEFGTMLESLGVNSDELYESLDIHYQTPKEDQNSNSTDRGNKNRKFDTTFGGESQNTTDTSTKETSLGNLSESFEKMDSDDMNVSPLFIDQFNNPKPGFDNASLLKSFPLPKGKTLFDFKAENIQKKPRMINVILKDEKSHPLISASTTDKFKEQRAKKSMIIKLLFDANPSRKQIPLPLAQRLFPANENPDGKTKIPDLRWKNRIEQDLIIPLMRNNFCDTHQEQLITKEIKKGYMTYLNNLMLNTPALQDFECKPEEIILKNEKVTLPLYLKGQKEVNSYLTVDNGNIYLTNTLYNPTDPDPNSISKGKVMLGSMDDFKNFSEKITNHITPDIIQKSLSDSNPRTQYSEQIQDIIHDQIENSSKDLSTTKAGISHGLAGSKAQDSILSILKNWHKDKINNDENIHTIDAQSPFYATLRDYTTDPEKKITKENDKNLFESLSLSKNTILRNSAQENEQFSTDIQNLQQLITNADFNERLQSYLTIKPSDEFSTQRHNILQILNAANRTKPESITLFLQLFGTNPEKGRETINSINSNKFHNFIQQLIQVKDFNIINMNDIISSHNPTLATLEEKYAPSADENLENALDDIDDVNTIEIIKE